MKTTIPLDAGRALIVEPAPAGKGGAQISFTLYGAKLGTATLTPEQCDAVTIALEIVAAP